MSLGVAGECAPISPANPLVDQDGRDRGGDPRPGSWSRRAVATRSTYRGAPARSKVVR